MKTIVKKGKSIFQAKCPRCECEFTYDLDDLKRDSYTSYITSVICPECEYRISHEGRIKELKEYE